MENDVSVQRFTFFAIVAILLALLVYHFPIVHRGPWAFWRLGELSVLNFINTHIYRLEYGRLISDALEVLIKMRWASLDSEFVSIVSSANTRVYFGPVYTGIIAFIIYRRVSLERFNRALDFDQLLEALSRHFRFARCMISLDPTANCKVLDFAAGPFRLKEKIIPYLEARGAIGQYQHSPTSDIQYYMHHDKAHEALVKTLGRRFTGVDNLHYYEKWLFAAFVLYAKSEKIGDSLCREGDLILGDISYHINGELRLKRVNKLTQKVIEKYSEDPQIKKCLSSHWYVSGVLKELFHQAKAKGTHPSLHFPWLPTVDRTLALILEETGMPDERGAVLEVSSPESGIECLYPRLHWTNEKMLGVRIESPACEYILTEIESILINNYAFIPELDAKEMIAKKAEKQRKKKQESESKNPSNLDEN